MMLDHRIGDGLTRQSYDLLHLFRGDIHTDEAVIVYLDDVSHKELHQRFGSIWDRSLHAQLLERLKADGAKAVVFDVVFSDPGQNAATDAHLAQAMRAQGKVILAGLYVPTADPGLAGLKLDRPNDLFRNAAAGWGVANFDEDVDQANRRHFLGTDEIPGLAWAAAKSVEAPVTQVPAEEFVHHWINYYGPPGTIPSVSYYKALDRKEVPPEFFRGKAVFVGERPTAGFTGAKREEFPNPYTRWTGKFSPGVEVHANAFLNLLHGDWLDRFSPALELAGLMLLGAAFGFGLVLFQPLTATGIAVAGATLVAAGAWGLAWHQHIWFAWMIPVAAQIPAALLWSILFNASRSYIDKRLLEQSLSMYVSVPRAKELLRHPELLRPGAEQVQVSILFTDIAKFSTITERMLPRDLVKLLNDYFDISIQCIQQPEGTVMKLIGDAVFAIWNAPEPQPNHPERACRAALMLREKLVDFDVRHKTLPLKTRIGLHTGLAYVGNFGSEKRFDYTAIGDSINLASRLEGLNKYLGTDILASRDILQDVDQLFATRRVGHFRLKGFTRVIEVYELIGAVDCVAATQAWRTIFEDALYHFQRAEFASAAEAFRETLRLKPGDGPSQFYLQQIEEFRRQLPAEDWAGEIEIKEK